MKGNPDLAKELKLQSRELPGRPRIKESQPELLKAIAEIAMFGASAHDRRRTEALRSCKTLTQLHLELEKMGFSCSKTSTYYRLLPKNSSTIEGKRHINTVKVKLCRAQSDLHKDHSDQLFALATIRSLEFFASILGPNQTAFISQDDKARVPIGITAANKQAPFIMHMEYKVRLPDHDWVIAGQHKLIPSVIGAYKIHANEIGKPDAVSYSGPTYVAIRSAKHSTSNASTHAIDFDRLMELPSFRSFLKTADDQVRPVVIITCDGGPDENPRFPKVIAFAIQHFKKYDLDAIFIATNSPGRSAYNRIERRMAPLSRQLFGVVIPHDHFGSHLNNNCVTSDVELEKKNFHYAGTVLGELWSELVLDTYSVTAEYISETKNTHNIPEIPSAEWYAQHVRESQYFLQITKCTNSSCCGFYRSSLDKVLRARFLPPPYPILHQDSGPIVRDPPGSQIKLASLLSVYL